MSARKERKPKPQQRDILYLRRERRALKEVRNAAKRLPMNDAIRTALARVGISREITRYLQTASGVEVLLELRWTTIRDVFDHLFDEDDVDRIFRELE